MAEVFHVPPLFLQENVDGVVQNRHNYSHPHPLQSINDIHHSTHHYMSSSVEKVSLNTVTGKQENY
jgi:hypothetical protein